MNPIQPTDTRAASPSPVATAAAELLDEQADAMAPPAPNRPSPRLDELALRRTDFVEGEPITLSDGQVWTLPRPALTEFYPRPAGGGRLEMVPGFGWGPDYDALVDAYIDSTSVDEEYAALAALAFDLLARNYRVEPSHLRTLLRYKHPDDSGAEANHAMWRAVRDLALGRVSDPKGRTPVG